MNLSLVTQQRFNLLLCDIWQSENNDVFMTREQIGQALEYADPKKGIENLHARNKERLDGFSTTLELRALDGKMRETVIYNEKGIYEITRFSKQSKADKFYDFVYQVLEDLRRNQVPVAQPSYAIEDPIKRAERWIEEQKEKQHAVLRLEAQKPKVLFAESVEASESSILIRELAVILKQNGIDTGEKRLYTWLRENGYLVKRLGSDRNSPTQKSMNMGLFEIKETPINHNSGLITVNKTTKITGKGQVYFINKFLAVEKAI